MSEKDRIKLKEKLLRGLEKSYKDLLASKKRNNEELIILQNDQIVKIKL
jgi:sulfur carrier protein ThiS